MATEPTSPPAPEPTAPDLERMRVHRREVHGEDFDPEHDVWYPGHEPEAAPLTYMTGTDGAAPAYRCDGCPGRRFTLTDPGVGTPERRAYLRSSDPKLRTLLATVAPADEDDFIDRYEQRRLGEWLPVVAPDLTPPTKRRGVTARRIERCLDFLYERRLAGRTIEDAISDLTDLHETNRDRYCEIVGDATLYAAQTFRDYYKELSVDKKKTAKETCRRLRESGEAKPKYGKFTG